MIWIGIVIGYLAIAICLAILVMPKIVHKIVGFFSIGNRIYMAGYIRIAFGILLLFLATQSKLWGYVVTMGLLSATSGACIFFFGLTRTKNLFNRFKKHPSLLIRLYSSLALVIWAILLYALLP